MSNGTQPKREQSQLLKLLADALHFEDATVAEGDWGRMQLTLHYWNEAPHWGYDLHVWTQQDGKERSQCVRWGYVGEVDQALLEGLKHGEAMAALVAAGETLPDAPHDPRYPDC